MQTKQFIRKNSHQILLTVGCVCWIILLFMAMFLGERNPVFFDALAQKDVSDAYSSHLPFLRIIFEPLIGVIFTVGENFSILISLFLLIYIIHRVWILISSQFLQKTDIFQTPSSRIMKNTLEFTFRWGILVFLSGLIILLIGFIISGFLFITNNFRWVTKGILWINFTLFFTKLVYNSILWYKHKNLEQFSLSFFKNPLINRISSHKFKSTLKLTKREILHLVEVFWIILVFSQAFLTIRLPNQRIVTELAEDEFLFDFHVHTQTSDGTLTVPERIKWYIDQGISGAAFSDHHHTRGSLQAQAYVDTHDLEFTVFLSQEFTDDPENIHLNIYGLEEEITPTDYVSFGRSPNTMNCSEVITYVKQHGGYITVNHFADSLGDEHFSLQQLRDWGVDGFEIINGGREQTAEIRQFCLDNNLICMAGTDEHQNKDINTFVKLRLDDPTNKSLDAIFNALKSNNHQAVLVKYHYTLHVDRSDLKTVIVGYFLTISKLQVLSWIIWSIVIFGANQLIIFINHKYLPN